MIVQSWVDIWQQSFANLLANTINFIPSLVLAIIIFVVGWFIGGLLGTRHRASDPFYQG
jgi:hypothetical protein